MIKEERSGSSWLEKFSVVPKQLLGDLPVFGYRTKFHKEFFRDSGKLLAEGNLL